MTADIIVVMAIIASYIITTKRITIVIIIIIVNYNFTVSSTTIQNIATVAEVITTIIIKDLAEDVMWDCS